MVSVCKELQHVIEDFGEIRIGFKNQPLKIADAKSGFSKSEYGNDRFKVSFNIAGNVISWEVIFDQLTPLVPPDIIIGAEDEEFCPELESLQGYVNWDPSSTTCLSDLLIEVIQRYSCYQKKSVLSLPRLQDQWTKLRDTTKYIENSEVYVAKNGPGTYNTVATFLFDLSFDLSGLPPYLIGENLGEDKAALQLIFQQPDLTTVESQLLLSPRLEHALGGSASLRIPSIGMSDLASYIETVEDLLRNSIQEVTSRYVKRKEIISCFVAEFHGSVVEYDAEKFNQITLLLSHRNFFFILFVLLGERFPTTAPTLVMQSAYHMVPRGPYRQTHKGYLYSPNWTAQKIVQSIREYLGDVVMDFKQESIRACK